MAVCVSPLNRYNVTHVKKEKEEEEFSRLSDISDYLSDSSDGASYVDIKKEISVDDNDYNVDGETDMENGLPYVYIENDLETDLPDTKPVISVVPVIYGKDLVSNKYCCPLHSNCSKDSNKNKSLSFPDPYVKLFRCDHLLKKSSKHKTSTSTQTSYTKSVCHSNNQSSFKQSDAKSVRTSSRRSRQPSKLIYSEDFAVDGIDDLDDLYNDYETDTYTSKRSEVKSLKLIEIDDRNQNEKGILKKRIRKKTKKVHFKLDSKKAETNINLQKNFSSRDNFCDLDLNKKKNTCSNAKKYKFSETGRLVPEQNVEEGPVPVSMAYVRDGIWTVEPVNLLDEFDREKAGDLSVDAGGSLNLLDDSSPVEMKSEEIDYEYEQQQLLQQEQYFDDTRIYGSNHGQTSSCSNNSTNRDITKFADNSYSNLSQTPSCSGNSAKTITAADRLRIAAANTKIQLSCDEILLSSDEDDEIDVVTDYPVPIFITDLDKVHHDHTYVVTSEEGILEGRYKEQVEQVLTEVNKTQKQRKIEYPKKYSSRKDNKWKKLLLLPQSSSKQGQKHPALVSRLKGDPPSSLQSTAKQSKDAGQRSGAMAEQHTLLERRRRSQFRADKESLQALLKDVRNQGSKASLSSIITSARKEVILLLLLENTLILEKARLRKEQQKLKTRHEILTNCDFGD